MAGPLQVIGPRNGDAPLVYQVSDPGIVGPMTIRATFDGSSASGDFVPMLTFRAQDGTILARTFPSSNIAAGDSASVNYAPFLGIPNDGLRFGVNNEGNWLNVLTDDTIPNFSGNGIQFQTQNGASIGLLSDGSTDISSNSGVSIINHDSGSDVTIQSDGALQITAGNTTILSIAGGVDGDIDITTNGSGTQRYQSADGFIWVDVHTASGENVYVFHLAANNNFIIRDSGNNPIFYITESGPTYHIKSGAAWVADL